MHKFVKFMTMGSNKQLKEKLEKDKLKEEKLKLKELKEHKNNISDT